MTLLWKGASLRAGLFADSEMRPTMTIYARAVAMLRKALDIGRSQA